MHRYAVAMGLGAFALGFVAGYAVDTRKSQAAATKATVVAAVDLTRAARVLRIEQGDANGALAADYSWQRWPSVTDF